MHREDGLRALVVPRPGAPRDVAARVRAALETALAEAGALALPVEVDVVQEIEREPGPAGKVKLVKQERRAAGS